MNWGELGGWVAAVVALIGAVFVYGKLAQQVADHRQGIRDLWGKSNEHSDKIADLHARVTVLEHR